MEKYLMGANKTRYSTSEERPAIGMTDFEIMEGRVYTIVEADNLQDAFAVVRERHPEINPTFWSCAAYGADIAGMSDYLGISDKLEKLL